MYRLLVVLLFIVGCNAQSEKTSENDADTITLSGTIGYPQNGEIILEKYVDNQTFPYDTIKLKEDYTFSKEVAISTPGYYRLNFYNKQFVPLILHRDDVQVSADGNARNGFAKITGSRDHAFIEKTQQILQDFQSSAEVQQVNQQFRSASQQQDEQAIDSLREEYMKLDAQNKEKIIDLIDSVGASLGVVEILKGGRVLDKDQHYDLYAEYAALLKEEIPESPVAQDFVTMVDDMAKLAIGKVAPEIALPNPEGDTVKLSSLRGNYVLVDFWAKWCKPCRAENPNVVRMYNRFNDKGFEVYGVSLDRRKSDWLQAIEEDNLYWTQVSDLKFWNSKAAEIYNIKAIPFAVLLDPEGRIIAKNLRGRALEQKLEEIFNEES